LVVKVDKGRDRVHGDFGVNQCGNGHHQGHQVYSQAKTKSNMRM